MRKRYGTSWRVAVVALATFFVLGGCERKSAKVPSFSLAWKDSGTLRVEGVFLFPDGYPADDAEARAAQETSYLGPGARVLDIDRSGRLVQVHAELDMPDLTQ